MIAGFLLCRYFWRINKWEAFVLGEFIFLVWYFLSDGLHHLKPDINIIFVAFLADGPTEFFSHVLKMKFSLPAVVKTYTKSANPAIKEAVGNLIDHLINDKIAYNLYGNLIFFKLKPFHFPKSKDYIGASFDFIRHEGDFLCNQSSDLKGSLKDFQIEDFSIIQNSIRTSWHTIAYGDINVLLKQLSYLIRNIKMKRDHIKVERLFIFPYWKDDGPYDILSRYTDLESHLRNITINSDEMNAVIDTSSEKLKVDINELSNLLDSKYSAVVYQDQIKRALLDAIFLVWLVKIHEEFGIDYRILYRHDTMDNNNIDVVGKSLLREKSPNAGKWKDEGSALLDESVIVRFDDKTESDGYIYYQFILDPSEVEAYKCAFHTIWSSGSPDTHKLEETLNYFFCNTTATSLKALSASNWIEAIKKELNHIA